MYYVSLDIGCIECGEDSSILGIFTSREKAEAVCEEHRGRQKSFWRGEHHFAVEEVPELDKEIKAEYA